MSRTWIQGVVVASVLVTWGCTSNSGGGAGGSPTGSGGSSTAGQSGGSKGSSDDPNFKRCQAACNNLCLNPYCNPCSVDDCVTSCLGFTTELDPVCAQCIAANVSYGDGYRDGGKICVATFESTASSDCAAACIGSGGSGSSGGATGSGSQGSSDDPNLKRCQAACTTLCLDPYCSPCSVDDCVSTCLGFTSGLDPVCAQCIATNVSYGDGYKDGVKICVAIFESTASTDCTAACIGRRDAAAER